MLLTTLFHVCSHCGGEHLQKNGHTNHGAQRASLPKGYRSRATRSDY